MRFHVVFGRPLDVAGRAHEAAERLAPRHAVGTLIDHLSAEVHAPTPDLPIVRADRLRSRLIGRPETWAFARRFQAGPDDVVFCSGEDVALPLAATLSKNPRRPRLATFIHNLDRPRGRLARSILRLREHVDLFITNSEVQESYLRRWLHSSRVARIPEKVDTAFFEPRTPATPKERPIVASVGLEQRDYRTLAQATEGLDIDVRISAFSRDVRSLRRSVPHPLPAHMEQRFYAWNELVDLYAAADVVVVPLFPSRFYAGMTAILEALACARPVVVTATEGLTPFLASHDVAVSVPPRDPRALRNAIVAACRHPDGARERAQRGHAWIHGTATLEHFVERLGQQLRSLAPTPSPAPPTVAPWTSTRAPAHETA